MAMITLMPALGRGTPRLEKNSSWLRTIKLSKDDLKTAQAELDSGIVGRNGQHRGCRDALTLSAFLARLHHLLNLMQFSICRCARHSERRETLA
jgi:hypothetical protein